MRARVFFSIVVTLIILSAKAESSQWLANMISEQEGSTNKANNIANSFFSNHGLILFYGSQCPHCKQFAPVLKTWAAYNKVEVLPLSLDNQPLPEFPQYKPATTEWITAAFGSNAINYPAVFLINPKTKVLYPVGFGSMSESELNERMDLLIPKIKAYETKGSL